MSVASCESLIEEEEGGELGGVDQEGGSPSTSASPSPTSTRLRKDSRNVYERKLAAASWNGASTNPSVYSRISVDRQRYSLPPPPPVATTPVSSNSNSAASSQQSNHGMYPSFGGISRSNSPLGRSYEGTYESAPSSVSPRLESSLGGREKSKSSSSRRKSRAPTTAEELMLEPGRDGERKKREERRWRIALELRDTERTYVKVLEEINQVSLLW